MKKLTKVEIVWQETESIRNNGKVSVVVKSVNFCYSDKNLKNRKRWADTRWKERVSYEFKKEYGYKPSFEDVQVKRFYE